MSAQYTDTYNDEEDWWFICCQCTEHCSFLDGYIDHNFQVDYLRCTDCRNWICQPCYDKAWNKSNLQGTSYCKISRRLCTHCYENTLPAKPKRLLLAHIQQQKQKEIDAWYEDFLRSEEEAN